jgi:hypothetical protein
MLSCCWCCCVRFYDDDEEQQKKTTLVDGYQFCSVMGTFEKSMMTDDDDWTYLTSLYFL